MLNIRHHFLAILLLAAIQPAQALICQEVFPTNSAPPAANLNRFLRSNPGDFFNSVAVMSWFKSSRFASFTGPVFGDGHISNMNVDYVAKQARWTSVDRDDMGDGPLMTGIAKTVALAKTATDKIKSSEMVQAYMNGLAGSHIKEPHLVKKLMKVSYEEHQKSMHEYATKHSNEDQIKSKEGTSQLTDSRLRQDLKKTVEESFSSTEFLDAVSVHKTVGGSANAVRFHVLVRIDGKKYFLDMKEILPTALRPFIKFWNPRVYMESLFKRLYGNDLEYRKVVDFNGRVFALTLKNDFERPLHEPPKDHEVKDFIELNLYNIYMQGLYARNSEGGAQLLKAFEKDPEAIEREIHDLAKEYLKQAEKKWEDQRENADLP